jgi:hypothetical protein
MRTLLLLLRSRLIIYTAVLLITAVLLAALLFWSGSIFLAIPLIAFAALAAIGTHDLLQTRLAVLRNYPLTAHIRFILEEIRPERERRYSILSRQARHRLPARQARFGQTTVRHAKRCLCWRL